MPKSAAALLSARSSTFRSFVVAPVPSVRTSLSPLTDARTEMSSEVLIRLMTSSTVTAEVVSMTALLPLRSVMRKSPRRTPAPPLSVASSVWGFRLPPPS